VISFLLFAESLCIVGTSVYKSSARITSRNLNCERTDRIDYLVQSFLNISQEYKHISIIGIKYNISYFLTGLHWDLIVFLFILLNDFFCTSSLDFLPIFLHRIGDHTLD